MIVLCECVFSSLIKVQESPYLCGNTSDMQEGISIFLWFVEQIS